MRKTQLIVFERPNNSRVIEDVNITTPALRQFNGATYSDANYYVQNYGQRNIIRQEATEPTAYSVNGRGMEIDLYDDVSIPITYTILDVREPEKRKTSWSKTITIPGTKNNNRIFSHIYDIAGDAWIKIGDKSVWSAFNPNLKTEVILLNDGIQVMKGNMQLKQITRDNVGNLEYEIAINGDLTSLFFDVGNKKLADLEWSEWTHNWTRQIIEKSWSGISTKSDGSEYQSIYVGALVGIQNLYQDQATGRLAITTTLPHGLAVEDWVIITGITTGQDWIKAAIGTWVVTAVPANNKIVVNYFYPKAFAGQTKTPSASFVVKTTATGRGYVYPMISWGDEYDFNSFPVTSFVPGFYVKEIWDKIFAETNSSYVSNFLDSQFFKRLIIIQKKPQYELTSAQLAKRKFWVGTTQSYYTLASGNGVGTSITIYPQVTTPTTENTTLLPIATPNRIPFGATAGGLGTQSFYDNFGNWNPDKKCWVVKEPGEYKINASFKFSVWCDMNGYNGGAADGTASFQPFDVLNNYHYYPRAEFTSNPGNNNGLVITTKLKRSRNGQAMPDLMSNQTTVFMGNQEYLTSNDRSKGSSTGHWAYFGRYQPLNWQNIQVNISGSAPYFAVNDEVWLEVSWYVNALASNNYGFLSRSSAISFHEINEGDIYQGPVATDIRGEWSLRIEPAAYIFDEPSTKSTEGALINGNQFLPKDFSCKDFLLAIIKSFNLHIEADRQVERKYYIEPRDDYYYTGSNGASDYVDWTSKVDMTTVKIEPMGALISKNYIFSNKEENDFWNKRFKDERGRGYSSYTKEILNDFLKNETKIDIPLGTTVMINNPEGSDVVMPSILQKEASGAYKPVSSSLPRMLIWGGVKPYTMQRGGSAIALQNPQIQNGQGWEMLSSIQQTSATSSQYFYYPYAGTVDSPPDPHYDINWFNMEEDDFVYWDLARWTNHNLYNAYWSNFINEISDPASKVIRAYLKLDPTDIYNLDFRKIYVIDGNYLRLQKIIDYDPVTDGLTQCEFLKLKSPTKYKRQSIIVDDLGISTNVFTPDTIPTIGGFPVKFNVPPRKKVSEFGFTNNVSGSSLSNNGSITVNGKANFVAVNGRNIKLNGNENAVGDGAENVHVSSGNGNFISGGLKNVNLIGTDKKFIEESDVTYINNIRYKNGSPISRAMIIDAGLNTTLYRQSNNTTCNIVDSGEDVVIEAGSTTFENVVNAGVDRILPDIPDLGLGTAITPNPRTNRIGGFNSLGATASITEVIRDQARNAS